MLLIKNDGHIRFIEDKKKIWDGYHLFFLVYHASKLSTVYVVKWPVLGLQRVPENSELAPSLRTLWTRQKKCLLLDPFPKKLVRSKTILEQQKDRKLVSISACSNAIIKFNIKLIKTLTIFQPLLHQFLHQYHPYQQGLKLLLLY